jgi:hypothetical protein
MLGLVLASFSRGGQRREFLTPDEIEKIQDAQEIDARVKVYLQAASLRLKTAMDRLSGKESASGDPLEFFSVEDMLDGYYQILHSVMLNLDNAAQNPLGDQKKSQAALKNLKTVTEASLPQLQALKKLSEDQQREGAWKLIGNAIEITNGAHEGAAKALARKSAAPGTAGVPPANSLAIPRPKAAGETPAVPGAIVTIIGKTR